MVLQALTQYYNTLCENGEIAPQGWESGKVSFGIDISENGDFLRLIDLRETFVRGKKTIVRPHLMPIPSHAIRSNGVVPNFLCDNPAYMLGIATSGDKDKAIERYASTQRFHKELLSPLDEPAAKAILAFFEKWHPDEAEDHPEIVAQWDPILKGVNLVFCYNGIPVTENQNIQDAWNEHYSKEDPTAVQAQCLVSGEISPIARIHPKIKGVHGAQSSGASLCSYNRPAFCHYNHDQNYNAPVSEKCAFQYTTALNTLLSDPAHNVVVGDTTIVCWAENGNHDYQDAYLATLFGTSQQLEDGVLTDVLRNVANGYSVSWNNYELNNDERFYVLGLSPNASRLSVRFFYYDTFGNLLKNIWQHYEDIAIARPAYDKWEYLPIYKLLDETVSPYSSNKSANPKMAGEVLEAVLYGRPYPASLINGVRQRIRADGEVNRVRMAIIKGYYIRRWRSGVYPNFPQEVLTMALNPNSDSVPYNLGRLFNIFEQLQDRANYPNKLNSTIKDRYFRSASRNPSQIMPKLCNLAQVHLSKLESLHPDWATYFNKKISDIYWKLDGFPKQMSSDDINQFQLGYYHEDHERYVSKAKKMAAATDASTTEQANT